MAATTATVLAGISAASSLVGGMQQQAAAKQQAENAKATAAMQAAEQQRVAAQEARVEKEKVRDVLAQQKVSYLKSGVSLEGTPLLMMEATRLQGEQNVDEILEYGGAAAASSLTQGQMKAAQYKASGRQAFMSGLTSAAGYGAQAYDSYTKWKDT